MPSQEKNVLIDTPGRAKLAILDVGNLTNPSIKINQLNHMPAFPNKLPTNKSNKTKDIHSRTVSKLTATQQNKVKGKKWEEEPGTALLTEDQCMNPTKTTSNFQLEVKQADLDQQNENEYSFRQIDGIELDSPILVGNSSPTTHIGMSALPNSIV